MRRSTLLLASVTCALLQIVPAGAETAVDDFSSLGLFTLSNLGGAHPEAQTHRPYGGWKIVSFDHRTFYLTTETCQFKIDSMPPLASAKTREQGYRLGETYGAASALLKRRLIRGDLDDWQHLDWSNIHIRTKDWFDLVLDYNFVGVLSNPTPIAMHGPISAKQPGCSDVTTKIILIGRGADWPAENKNILFDILELDLDRFKTERKFDYFFCSMRKDAFSESDKQTMTEVGLAFLKALLF